MFSILLTSSRILANTTGMDAQKKTVSAERMQEEWLEIQAAQSDPAMFRPLYVRYYEMVFRFIYRRTASEELSADICSQVFLKAMQRLSDYSFKGVPFSAWLFRIASNEVAQHFRQQQKNRVLSIEETQIGDVADEIDEDDNEALRAALLLALDDLKEGDMELIEMRFFEQRSFKEIADITGMTESNAKVKTYRILERLKKRLST
ncbi:MAG: sigma-70 family RNA polymerase sigma factor [Saprospiraceae bacterium]|nr:sigma-70 family RNA polymerase sigma factor [Saprospiraceae bacterium]